MAVGSEALGLAPASLAVVRFKQHQVHCTDAAETTGVTNTAEYNAAKPDVGKAAGSSMPFPADVTINWPKNKCMITYILAICYLVFFNVKLSFFTF